MLGVKLRSLICSPMIKKTLVILVLCCWDFDNLLHRSIAAGICLIHPAELRIMWTFLVSDIMSLAASSAPSVVLLIYLTGCFLRTEGFHRNRGNIWRKIILYLSGLKIYWWVDVSLTNLHKLMWKKKGRGLFFVSIWSWWETCIFSRLWPLLLQDLGHKYASRSLNKTSQEIKTSGSHYVFITLCETQIILTAFG